MNRTVTEKMAKIEARVLDIGPRTAAEMDRKAYYRKSVRLAKQLGCTIEISPACRVVPHEYWVWGPADVYGPGSAEDWSDGPEASPVRLDPWDGDHNACNWCNVWVRLCGYRADLALRSAGIVDEDHFFLLDVGGPLFVQWVQELEDGVKDASTTALALADHLEENDRDELAATLREGLARAGMVKV